MRKIMLLCAAICATVLVLAAPARATSVQTWVASSGADTGSCTQTAPCATFTYAMTQTLSGGAIGCLSSGSFGSITITGSITIDCGTGQEGTTTCGGSCTAIDINASSTANIALRHLNIKGIITSAGYGINASMAGGTLTVQDCTISGQGNAAISFAATSGRAQLIVSDTKISNNGDGIIISPNSGVIVSTMLDRVQITTIGDVGLWLNGSGTIAGSLRQSVIAGSADYGIYATATGGVYFTVEESSVIDNVGVGIAAFASGVNIGVGASTLGGNGTAVDAASGGSLVSFGNNQMSANGSNGSFTPGGPGLQ